MDLSSLFRLRFEIDDHWTLEGAVGGDSGGDLLYELEGGGAREEL